MKNRPLTTFVTIAVALGLISGTAATFARPTTVNEQISQVPQGAVTTATGLKYQDTIAGQGAQPRRGQVVIVHYTGWLTNGQKFDSSVDRGQPFEFRLGNGEVIKGWDEGVASMHIGGKRTLIIPASLAYGDRGVPGVIPPGSTLKFDVELLGVRN